MFPGAKVVAIDDDDTDLDRILVALKGLGLGCISYHYPDETPEEGISFSGLRLFITDINLVGGESPGDEGRRLAAVISLLERIITNDNGPYALITWSTTELHDALMTRIKVTESLKGRQPFFSMPLAKAEFLDDTAKLKQAVQRIFTDNAPFGALLDWERRVSRAGEKVLDAVDNFSEQFPGDNSSEKIDRMLSKLAVDAFGKTHAADHVFESVNEALVPILSDALSTEFFSGQSDDVWTRAVTKFNEANALAAETAARLNSMVNFEGVADIKPYRRGAILELPQAWMTDSEFEKRFGAKPNRLRGEVLKIDEPKSLRWVLVQAQAACDFAQDRVGPILYILGAVVPLSATRKQKDGKDLPLPASVWQSPTLSKYQPMCDGDFRLEIFYGIACHITRQGLEEAGFRVLGRLRDQIISTVGYEYHSHGSRLGFVSFR
jgi:hypothetical protein